MTGEVLIAKAGASGLSPDRGSRDAARTWASRLRASRLRAALAVSIKMSLSAPARMAVGSGQVESEEVLEQPSSLFGEDAVFEEPQGEIGSSMSLMTPSATSFE